MFIRNTKWALLWAMLIFILCAIPGRDTPFGSIWDILSLDKFIHASLFFIQAVLLIHGLSKQTQLTLFNKNVKISAVMFCVIYGGSLELMQGAFFEDRAADIYDFFANIFGAIAGVLLFERVLNKYKAYFN
ncbi:MAG: VanZ family protein [Bacteroidetes bacterium]|nr:VanZ family protein [Bacteroidota bacterium]